MIIEILISIVALELAGLIYLTFKKLPKESQKEILRKIEPTNSKVIEWVPPKSEERVAEEKIRENL